MQGFLQRPGAEPEGAEVWAVKTCADDGSASSFVVSVKQVLYLSVKLARSQRHFAQPLTDGLLCAGLYDVVRSGLADYPLQQLVRAQEPARAPLFPRGRQPLQQAQLQVLWYEHLRARSWVGAARGKPRPYFSMKPVSRRFAGIANAKTVDVTVEDDVLKASFGRAKTAKQPKKAKLVQIIKKNARRAIIGVGKQAGSVRPDLKVSREPRLPMHGGMRMATRMAQLPAKLRGVSQ